MTNGRNISDNLSNNRNILKDLVFVVFTVSDIKNVSSKNGSSSQAKSGQHDTVSLFQKNINPPSVVFHVSIFSDLNKK